MTTEPLSTASRPQQGAQRWAIRADPRQGQVRARRLRLLLPVVRRPADARRRRERGDLLRRLRDHRWGRRELGQRVDVAQPSRRSARPRLLGARPPCQRPTGLLSRLQLPSRAVGLHATERPALPADLRSGQASSFGLRRVCANPHSSRSRSLSRPELCPATCCAPTRPPRRRRRS